MRGILIDPISRTIDEVDFNGDYKQVYDLIDANTYTTVEIDDDNVIFVDDEGLLKNPRYFFLWRTYRQPLAGKGLILGIDQEGESVATRMGIGAVRSMVTFTELAVLGFETEEQENVELLPGSGIQGSRIKTRAVFGTPKDEGK